MVRTSTELVARVVCAPMGAFGVLTADQLHRWSLAFCGPACLLMLPVMLLRLDTYTGRSDAHDHRTSATAG